MVGIYLEKACEHPLRKYLLPSKTVYGVKAIFTVMKSVYLKNISFSVHPIDL